MCFPSLLIYQGESFIQRADVYIYIFLYIFNSILRSPILYDISIHTRLALFID